MKPCKQTEIVSAMHLGLFWWKASMKNATKFSKSPTRDVSTGRIADKTRLIISW